MVSFWKNVDWLVEKILGFFKIAKSSKVALQGHWKIKNCQNVEKLCVFLKKFMGFFDKNYLIFQKIEKGSKLALQCNWTSKNLQNDKKFAAFKKKDGFFPNKTFSKFGFLK